MTTVTHTTDRMTRTMTNTTQTQAAPKSPVATLRPGFTEPTAKAAYPIYGMPAALPFTVSVKDHADKFFLFTYVDVWTSTGWLITSVHKAQGLYVMNVRKDNRIGVLVSEGDAPLWHQSPRADHALATCC